ncbi:MAG: hypothetical protein JST16_07110 [Bdellovibrionales bacterium]|nr:hypothetical protein [Bdellovibrionales bacterium]
MPKPRIQRATVHALFAFDIGFEIRLSQIPLLFADRSRDPIRYSFLSRNIGRENQPLRIEFLPVDIQVLGHNRRFQLFATFFDVGCLSLEFMAPLEEDFDDLPALAAEFQNSKNIMQAARTAAESIFEQARSAVVNPEFFKVPSVYTVINVQQLSEELSAEAITQTFGATIAKALRASDEPMGRLEITRTLAPNLTYSDEDIVYISSAVAVIFDETSSEVIDILELANVQSMELKFIDARLDRTLQNLYEETDNGSRSFAKVFDLFERQTHKLNTIHLDSTIIVERVEQSFKFAQDTYRVRIHELAVQQMFLPSFSQAIDKKLAAIRDIVSDMRDRAVTRRMEILEWIIILLILIGTVPSIIPLLKH